MTIILAFLYENAVSWGIKEFEDSASRQVLSGRNPGPQQGLPSEVLQGLVDGLMPYA